MAGLHRSVLVLGATTRKETCPTVHHVFDKFVHLVIIMPWLLIKLSKRA